MKLGEKIRYLREVEGALRGFDRAMTQQEVVRAIKKDLKTSISQSYLSQIESGARPHLTNTTRLVLGKFFKAHPPNSFRSWGRSKTSSTSGLSTARSASAMTSICANRCFASQNIPIPAVACVCSS